MQGRCGHAELADFALLASSCSWRHERMCINEHDVQDGECHGLRKITAGLAQDDHGHLGRGGASEARGGFSYKTTKSRTESEIPSRALRLLLHFYP